MSVRALVLVALVALLASGCAAVLPAGLSMNESYLAHPDAYTVLGQVEGTSKVTGFLWFGLSGDAGLRAAMDDAIRKANADGLINVVADNTYSNMLFTRSIKTTVRGLAIKKK
jgi:hypothetical protein